MLIPKPHRSLYRHTHLVGLSCRSCLATNSAAASTNPDTEKLPVNDYGVPLLPENLRAKLFSKVRARPVTDSVVTKARKELTKFGLSSNMKAEFRLPDIANRLPDILNNNISDNMWEVARRQVEPYTSMLLELLSSPTPPRPSSWSLQPGWTRYTAQGAEAVTVPLERCLVLDVEVAVKEDPRAVMATAVSDRAWYSWLSPHLLSSTAFPSNPVVRIIQ